MSQKDSTKSKAAERAARLAQLRREQKRRERRLALVIWGVTGLVLVLLAGGVWYAVSAGNSSSADLSAVEDFPVKSNHVTGPVDYKQDPPVGGPHNPTWLNCGTYPTQVPSENVVHSLEHGAVWIAYDPGLAASDVQKLEDLTPSTYAILSPYKGLPSPVVVSGWGSRLKVQSADDPRIQAFIEEYRSGGNTPEVGASCSGGSDGTLPLGPAGG